jgi:hypothetical protein
MPLRMQRGGGWTVIRKGRALGVQIGKKIDSATVVTF